MKTKINICIQISDTVYVDCGSFSFFTLFYLVKDDVTFWFLLYDLCTKDGCIDKNVIEMRTAYVMSGIGKVNRVSDILYILVLPDQLNKCQSKSVVFNPKNKNKSQIARTSDNSNKKK